MATTARRAGRRLMTTGVLVLFVAVVASRAAPPGGSTPPGFWLGIWHGLLRPITFLESLFGNRAGSPAASSGHWYDFGFVLGAVVTASVLHRRASLRGGRHEKSK